MKYKWEMLTETSEHQKASTLYCNTPKGCTTVEIFNGEPVPVIVYHHDLNLTTDGDWTSSPGFAKTSDALVGLKTVEISSDIDPGRRASVSDDGDMVTFYADIAGFYAGKKKGDQECVVDAHTDQETVRSFADDEAITSFYTDKRENNHD